MRLLQCVQCTFSFATRINGTEAVRDSSIHVVRLKSFNQDTAGQQQSREKLNIFADSEGFVKAADRLQYGARYQERLCEYVEFPLDELLDQELGRPRPSSLTRIVSGDGVPRFRVCMSINYDQVAAKYAIGIVILEASEPARERSRQQKIVAVQEGHIGAMRLRDAHIACGRGSAILCADQSNAWVSKSLNNLTAAIGGTVVDHDQLEIGIVLAEHALDRTRRRRAGRCTWP